MGRERHETICGLFTLCFFLSRIFLWVSLGWLSSAPLSALSVLWWVNRKWTNMFIEVIWCVFPHPIHGIVSSWIVIHMGKEDREIESVSAADSGFSLIWWRTWAVENRNHLWRFGPMAMNEPDDIAEKKNATVPTKHPPRSARITWTLIRSKSAT